MSNDENRFVSLMQIQFWGVRGTLPVPGRRSVRYGGNTNCITLQIPGKPLYIFDAGTGIKALADFLICKKRLPLCAKIFISHPHWDHINGIPFFTPFYREGSDFEVFAATYGKSVDQLIFYGQMNKVYFPVTISEFASKVTFRTIEKPAFNIGDVLIKTIVLEHPGTSLGYRIEYQDRSFCYITDTELYFEDSPHYKQEKVDELVQFLDSADLLVMDTTYRDKEYIKKIGWGHSCISRAIEVADKAKVKKLCLYHHDPDQTDRDIDLKLMEAQAILKRKGSTMECIAPHEGDTLLI